MDWKQRAAALVLAVAVALPASAFVQDAAAQVTVDATPAGRRQVIDGFGTALNLHATEAWYQALLLDDLQASVVRMDISPRFRSPYSDAQYYSPWFNNSITLPGPEGNNARTYTGPNDYSRPYGGSRAPIAVMGPDINRNVALFDYGEWRPAGAGAIARAALSRRAQLGDFKLFGSTFSPAPWLKIASGSTINAPGEVFPKPGTPYPFVWNGNFSGGHLDVSDVPLEVFNDGTGPTSALTQYARSTAAYIRGFQNVFGVRIYALSIQNELNFEQFYDSCGYPLTSQLAAAIKVLRREFDKYPDLAPIQLIGPEDLLIDSPYSLWQFGGGANPIHKNLRYLHEMRANDPPALAALGFFAVHGEPGDDAWRWYARGWSATPEGTLPSTLAGFTSYGRKSWMTETSGDEARWTDATKGALHVAINIHRALTVGEQSAWLHWQLADAAPAAEFTLTDRAQGASGAKYVAAKHFFKPIRPNAQRVEATVAAVPGVFASAYVHDADRTITVVLINSAAAPQSVSVDVRGLGASPRSWTTFTSSATQVYERGTATLEGTRPRVAIPANGIVTLQGR